MKINNLKEMADTIIYMEEHGIDSRFCQFKTAPGKIATLNTLKATRDKLIKQQQSIRTRYYSARDKEKELYTIKRNVDIMLEDHSHERNRDRSVSHER